MEEIMIRNNKTDSNEHTDKFIYEGLISCHNLLTECYIKTNIYQYF